MDLIRTYVTVILSMLGLTVAVHSHSDDKRLLLDNEPTVDLGGEVSRLQAQLLDQQKLINGIVETCSIFRFIVVVHSHGEDKILLLDNEPTVDLGGEVSIPQAQLLDQQKIINAIQNELHLQMNTTTELKRQEVMLRQDNEQLKATQKAIQNELHLQMNTTAELKRQEVKLQQNITELKAYQKGSGSVYVRWGRTVCPSTASVVYTGYTAGKHYNSGGSGSDQLCLPSDPTWSTYVDGASSYRAYIYGTELQSDDTVHIFNYPVANQDVPCVVCRSTKTSTIMIPARNNCYDGWTMEYNGYLMTAYHSYKAYNHVCVDENPEFLHHGSTNDDEHLLYLVEGKCGSLQCPPYVEGRELACAVCSK